MVDLVFKQPQPSHTGTVDLRFGGQVQPETPSGQLVFTRLATHAVGRVDLRFGYTPPTPPPVDYGHRLVFDQPARNLVGAVDLRFGGDEQPEDPGETGAIEGVLESTLPLPRADIDGLQYVGGRIVATLPAATATFAGEYDVNVFRDPTAAPQSAWGEARRAAKRPVLAWDSAKQYRPVNAVAWRGARRVTQDATAQVISLPRRDGSGGGAWAEAVPVAGDSGLAWVSPPRAVQRPGDAWTEADPITARTTGKYRMPPRMDIAHDGRYAEALRLWPGAIDMAYTQARWQPRAWNAAWEQAWMPPYGESFPPVIPEPEEPPQYEADTILHFCAAMGAPPWILRFGVDPCAKQPVIVPIKKVYVVANSAIVTRVSDGAIIPAQSVSLSIDVDSFAWSLSANLLGDAALDLVRSVNGQPVEVEAQINGQTWRALVDRWSESRQFGQRSISVQGRGLAAYLADPYALKRAYTETQDRLAQQLAAQELPFGWSLDWGLEDWLVPAGAWSYDGRTPMAAIAAIATAAGGYVQGDMAQQRIQVAHRYPTAPWDWAGATPDVSLPLDVLTRLGTTWNPSQPANNVYVSGKNSGVLVRVQRTGTAGDISLPMQVDPLITEVVAGRQRGTADLAASHRTSTESLSLPLSDSLAGLVLPGQMLEVTGDDGGDWRGIVRATDVTASRGDGLSVRQKIDIERHHEAA